ncbi:glycosyltransferase family 4 protein [Stieleria sp. ICT_E10.1]|uniref:glycosyltransferase family 4 protein n=1 Tax=Stieleria sedimenti TaxID=2976331 RepID=UPI002180310C|nr:glycosyltransferase family 4 protein [Stieleria sedimenti]MCS7466758.1 glycosyltransferase family 4 protein [Stieleria sedimenti]
MKILYHHRTRGDGAEGVHIAEIVAALRDLGHEVQIVCPKSAKRSPGLDSKDPNVARKPRKLQSFLKQSAEVVYNVVSYFRVQRGISEYQPDFVYERYSSYNFAGVLAANRLAVPIIVEVNATFAGKFGSRFPVCFPNLLHKSERFVLENANGLVVVSKALESCVCNAKVDCNRVTVSPNAINSNRVAEINRDKVRDQKRRKLAIEDAVVIGFVGSLRKWHGIDFFAGAMAKIAAQFDRARFIFVGRGEHEPELRRQVMEAGIEDKVHFLGAIPHSDVYPWVAAMDIGVMPDSNEFGSPMKILEYMAMGCVPVGPRLGPIEEIIEDGVTGKLFDRRSESSFVQAIIELCNDDILRDQIGEDARKFVLKTRTWNKNAQDIVDLFIQIEQDRGQEGVR